MLLSAKETNALGGDANRLLCEGEGKLVLAWLAGRSPYQWLFAVWLRLLCVLARFDTLDLDVTVSRGVF